MGYDQRQQSGAAVAFVVALLLLAILGLFFVAGAALFWVRTNNVQMQAMASEQRAMAELRQMETIQADAMAELQEQAASVPLTPDTRLGYEVRLDRNGNTTMDGERIGLDELKAEIAKLKEETSNAFSLHINADSECPVKHLVSVLDVMEEVGDIDYRVASSAGLDSPSGESTPEN